VGKQSIFVTTLAAITLFILLCVQGHAEEEMMPMPEHDGMSMPSHNHESSTVHPPHSDCSKDEFFDRSTQMCFPLATPGMTMRMFMLHGNAFGVGIFESGPRGRTSFASPNMLMVDVGTSVSDRQYLNLELMATAELWTFPKQGSPELLQIGEANSQGQPYIDAQHPHSSPLMGLTLSDTIRLSDTNDQVLRLFFAPRGESTDGPIPFMHRPTGMVNPDAPLGHHIGQDVGHISSTVMGGLLKLNKLQIEASTFNGTEPEPTAVNLPIGTPNSYAARLSYEFTPEMIGMFSAAYINQPEALQPDIKNVSRYSASLYTQTNLGPAWNYYNSLIFGSTHHYDHVPQLISVGEEFLFAGGHPRIWGRIEALQRTPNELAITNIPGPMNPRWVGAFTLGYTHALTTWNDLEIALGASSTVDFLPDAFSSAYGGQNPWTWKVFLQIGGMKMQNF